MTGSDPYGETATAPNAFVSYRRRDTGAEAELLANRLNGDIGSARVFYDNDDLYAGDFIVEHLDEALAEADGVLALIGSDWAVEDGRNRIAEPGDHVRREVATALGHRTVIPVLVDGAAIPADLPADLARLPGCRWIEMASADHEPAYQEALVALWAKRCRKAGRMLVIGSPTEGGRLKVEEFLAELRDAGIESASAVSQFAAGIAAIPIRKARRRWPDIVVITDDDEPTGAFLARLKGMEYWGPARIALVAGAGAAAGAGGPALVRSVPELADAELFTSPARFGSALAASGVSPVALAVGSLALVVLLAGAVMFWGDDDSEVVSDTAAQSGVTQPTDTESTVPGTPGAPSSEPNGLGDWSYPGYTQDAPADDGGGGGDDPGQSDVPAGQGSSGETGGVDSAPGGSTTDAPQPAAVDPPTLDVPVVSIEPGVLATEAAEGCEAPCDLAVTDVSDSGAPGPLDGLVLAFQGEATWSGETVLVVHCGENEAKVPAGVAVVAGIDTLEIRITGLVEVPDFDGTCSGGIVGLRNTAILLG